MAWRPDMSYGMTLQEKHKLDLAKALKEQLGVTDEQLKEWETEDYPADGREVSRFWEFIKNAPAVRVVGDYDCDGICASHIMSTAIKNVFPEKRVSVRIPRRFSEGYGINQVIAEEIKETMPKGSVIITVDNGIAAAPILEDLKESGYTVLMTDHHELREGCQIPRVDMTIDPAVTELPNPMIGRYWCGAAVAYKLCEAVVSEELAAELSVYAGLATVADCMELKEGNWGLVRKSIQAFRNQSAPKALCDLLIMMKQDPNFCNEDHFGFYLGPAFNAPGRLLDKGANEVLSYLANPTEEKCEAIIALNNDRKRIRDEEYAIAVAEIERTGQKDSCPIWLAIPGLHEGIVGILAGKIAEEYKRPAIVTTTTETGLLKGSARSYGDFNIFEYLSSMPELFERMGGHKGAAGLSMTQENFEQAKKHQLSPDAFRENMTEPGIRLSIRQWEIPGIDGVLKKFRPFGEGNLVPRFDIEVDMEKDGARFIGAEKNHLLIQDKQGRYKITHFNHKPNSLSEPSHFGMTGTISGSAYAGTETPAFNGEEVFDLQDEREKGR